MKRKNIILILIIVLSSIWVQIIYAEEQVVKCEVYHSNELEELEVSSKDNLIAENWVWKAIFPSGSHNGVTGGYARRRIIDFERDITINDIEFIILGPSRGGISKFNISISNNAVNWVNIGYVKSAGTFGWEKILVKGEVVK